MHSMKYCLDFIFMSFLHWRHAWRPPPPVQAWTPSLLDRQEGRARATRIAAVFA